MRKAAGVLLFLILFIQGYAQTNEQKAEDLGNRAVEVMDKGDVAEAVSMLKEAQKLDPSRFDYPYEIAYAHYIQKEYKEAIKVLEKLRSHKNATDRLYQLLGNSYDLIGKPSRAIDTYNDGLKVFPNSGEAIPGAWCGVDTRKIITRRLSILKKGSV